MAKSRILPILRECAGQLKREIKIAMTPVPRNKKWVFLVGCYNSGTTLLAELMGMHSEISALPTEGHFITDEFIKDYDVGLPRMWVGREEFFYMTEDDEGPDPNRIKKEWGMRLVLSKSVLVEKSPPNSAKTRWLQKHFENSYFVGIMRNGYAVSEGITRKGDPQHIAGGWPIEMSAYQWKRSNEVLENDSTHLKHFMWITYEDLAANPVETLNKVAEFIGIPSFDTVDFDKSFSVHEKDEPIRNMNQESINRLSKEQIAQINKVAGDMLDKYGYPRL